MTNDGGNAGQRSGDSGEALVKSRQRVTDHGEVFTPAWLVEDMLDLVKDESERIDSRFLEPACGSGNFLAQILGRKLASARRRYGRSAFELRNQSLLGLMCTYGIELLPDNVSECRGNLLDAFDAALGLVETDELHRAAKYVLSQNIVHGDAMKMLASDGQPLVFAEWGYLGRGKFQRRDFRFDALVQSSAFSEAGTLFADIAKHEIFVPIRTYPSMTIRELSS